MTRLTQDYGDARLYLARVLPWPQPDDDTPASIGISYKRQDGKKFYWTTRAVSSVGDAVSLIDWLLKLKDTRDVYACMASLGQIEDKVSKRGYKYQLATRKQEFVVGLKSLFMDLDAKGAPDSYDTVEDAVKALFAFLKSIHMPAPSLMVRTGGGVHVYWTLDRILSPAEWSALAEALVSAALASGMKFDTGCTTDSVRILRIPCTVNHKFTPPKPVVLVPEPNDYDYSVERITQALKPFIAAPRPGAAKASAFVENPGLFQLKTPIAENDLSAGINDDWPKPPLKALAKACPFVKEAILTGGASYNEPLWHDTVQLAMWTAEGVAAAHVMSDQHSGYSAEDTVEKYDLAVEKQRVMSLGWLGCAKVAKDGAKPCKSCPHLAAGKSPLNFVTLVQPQINGAAYTSSIGGMSTVLKGNIDVPKGYTRDPSGYVLVDVAKDDGSTMQVKVNDYIMVDPWISKGPPRTFTFTTETEVGGSTVVNLPTSLIGSPDMRRELQQVGLMLTPKETKQTGEFFVAWTKRLKEIKDAVSLTAPFGWATTQGAVLNGFAYGGILHTPAGPRVAPQTEHALAEHYTPIGDLKPWYDAVNLVHGLNRLALDAILASSFGAPLIRFTGQPGLLMSVYSLESGVGKTTAMQTAQAVWGDPVKALQGLDDTSNSVLGKLGRLRHLPMFWDELKTDNDSRRMVNTLFTIARGREKLRMNQAAALRETGSWETLMISASNESLVDVVVSTTKMTGAGLYRLFEFTTTPSNDGQIAVSDASRIVAALKGNFGRPGEIYAKFLGANFAQVDKDVAAEMSKVCAECKIKPDERFWAALVASVVMGAKYANDLGLTKFHFQKLRKFMIEQLEAMRRLRDVQAFDMKKEENIANILSQFLRDMRARHTLVTETMWLGRGKPKTGSVKLVGDVSRIDSLLVHASIKDKRIRISIAGLNEWLISKDYAQHVFIEMLKSKFGATRTAASLGAGTIFSTGTEFVLDFDATQKSVLKFLADLTV